MSVTNLSRYGSTEAPVWAVKQRRKNAQADRKSRLEGLKRYRQEREAGYSLVRFDAAELQALTKASRAGVGGGSTLWALVSANAFSERGRTCIRISSDTAREWSAWMRQPGVDAFGDLLGQLDEIAGAERPEGKAIKIRIPEFREILATLEGPDRASIPDADIAAQFLRRARVENSLMYVYVSPAQAARLAEVFVAAKVDRLLVVPLDHIAGRTEPRPF